MADDLHLDESVSHRKLFLPALVASYSATGPLAVVMTLFLIDMGNTFHVEVGVMGQVNTAASITAVAFGLLMGFLSVRFRRKPLLLFGLLCMSIAALGCFLAPDFTIMLMSYALSGIGLAMVLPMTITLVGEHFSLEKRASAVGWIIAGGSLAYVIGGPIAALVGGLGGWRFGVLWFVLPISLVSLLLAFFEVPSGSQSNQPTTRSETYLGGFKGIFSNISATACLVGDTLRSAAFAAVVVYATSFVRQRFDASTDLASMVLLGGALFYALGSIITVRIVNRTGRKFSAVWTVLLAGVFTISYAYVHSLGLSLALICVASWFFGMSASACNSLSLEQVPKFRGTMMSLDSAAINLGSAFGTTLGGLVLLSYGYEGMGIVLGITGVVGAMVLYFLSKDPIRT